MDPRVCIVCACKGSPQRRYKVALHPLPSYRPRIPRCAHAHWIFGPHTGGLARRWYGYWQTLIVSRRILCNVRIVMNVHIAMPSDGDLHATHNPCMWRRSSDRKLLACSPSAPSTQAHTTIAQSPNRSSNAFAATLRMRPWYCSLLCTITWRSSVRTNSSKCCSDPHSSRILPSSIARSAGL